jgi:apolipoprotein N-acyltransferase
VTAGELFNGVVVAAVAGTFIWHVWQGYRAPLPPVAPTRPQDASDDAEWLLLPFQAVAGLAGLCWLLVWLAVFLAPLAFVVLLVAGLVAR